MTFPSKYCGERYLCSRKRDLWQDQRFKSTNKFYYKDEIIKYVVGLVCLLKVTSALMYPAAVFLLPSALFIISINFFKGFQKNVLIILGSNILSTQNVPSIDIESFSVFLNENPPKKGKLFFLY